MNVLWLSDICLWLSVVGLIEMLKQLNVPKFIQSHAVKSLNRLVISNSYRNIGKCGWGEERKSKKSHTIR